MSYPQALIATVAREFLGLRETSRNQGPHLQEFWNCTNYRDGMRNREPWCSAFVAFCVWEADRRSELLNFRIPPRFAAVKDWLPWARNRATGCLIYTPADVRAGRFTPMPGDIAIMLPILSHVGIIATQYAGKGVIELIEGNTNEAGSREGEGVYEKERPLVFPGTFIRVPAQGLRVK